MLQQCLLLAENEVSFARLGKHWCLSANINKKLQNCFEKVLKFWALLLLWIRLLLLLLLCLLCLLKTSFVITNYSGPDLWHWWKFRFGPLNVDFENPCYIQYGQISVHIFSRNACVICSLRCCIWLLAGSQVMCVFCLQGFVFQSLESSGGLGVFWTQSHAESQLGWQSNHTPGRRSVQQPG